MAAITIVEATLRALRGLTLRWDLVILVVTRTHSADAGPVHARGSGVAVGLQDAALGEGRSRGEAENSDYDQAAHRLIRIGGL